MTEGDVIFVLEEDRVLIVRAVDRTIKVPAQWRELEVLL